MVRFNTAVSGVDVNDFMVAGKSTSRISDVHAMPDDRQYQVTIQYTQPAGTLLLALVDNDTIINNHHVPLGGTGLANGNAVSSAYTVSTSSAYTAIARPKSGTINVGQRPAIALTSQDVPIISYYDVTNGDLKLTLCESQACLVPIIRTIDSTDDVGTFSAISLSKTNIPYIAYYDVTNGNLKLAICKNALCTSSTIMVIDNDAADVGQFVNMKLSSAGIPIISYYDATNTALKVLHCGNTSCKGITRTTLALPGMANAGYANALTLSRFHSGQSTAPDLPRISYYDRTNTNVMIVLCTTQQCSAATLQTVAASVSGVTTQNTSIDINSENLPVISYIDSAGDLKIATCQNTTCTGFNTISLAALGDITYTSLKLTSDEIPIIAMVDSNTNILATRECITAACTTQLNHGNTPNNGQYPALALNSMDLPVTAYYDATDLSLKLGLSRPIVDDGSLPRFNKTAPSHNSVLSKTKATLTWQNPVAATGHAYEYCLAASIATCTNWTNVGTATSVTVNLSPSSTYFWHVRVINPANITESAGGYWSFRIK
jgi:hypothetical protein